MSKAKPDPQSNLFEPTPVINPKFTRLDKDLPMPSGHMMIRVPHKYLMKLAVDPIDRYILGEHLQGQDEKQHVAWYAYTPETLRILNCPSYEEFVDAQVG